MTEQDRGVIVRNTVPGDFDGIQDVSREVYAASPPWSEAQLSSHLRVFPEGQFVAVAGDSGRIVGMAASLIVLWDDYDLAASWHDFTDSGLFTNHDPERGRTLYGAEIMVRPGLQGRGIGKKLYEARRRLVQQRGLLRIRAGARLRGYHRYAGEMTAEDYVIGVVNGRIGDPTLSFQLRQGFRVLAVVPAYLHRDPESLGFAAVIEWINSAVARPDDYGHGDPRFDGSGG
jgi:GNAT superfamily N-acetyltransferase